jgi:glucose/arabinose dehydrogenase
MAGQHVPPTGSPSGAGRASGGAPGRRLVAGLLTAGLLAGCTGDAPAAPGAGETPSPTTPPAAAPSPTAPAPDDGAPEPASPGHDRTATVDAGAPQVLVEGLAAPWDVAFLPDGDALVSERDTARLLRVPAGGGQPQEVGRVPGVEPAGEGGLLGLAVSPAYEQDGLVYAYLTTGRDNRIVRFPLPAGGGDVAPEPVLTGIPSGRIHNGGRILFGPDRNLYAGTGDAGNTALSQDDGSLGGKVLALTPDGEPPEGATSVVLSKGHRNVQGLAFDADDRLWSVEFGQNRFDEVNRIEPGENYGWPVVEGPDDGGGRFRPPVVVWDPAEASPSGAAVVGSDLWVAALRGQRLWRVPLRGPDAADEPAAVLRGDYGRLRHAERAPDGSLWVLTSNRDGRGDPAGEDDRILRLPPG